MHHIDGYQLVIITPFFEDQEAITQLFKELRHQFKSEVFVVTIDDGSIRQPLNVNLMEKMGINGVILKLYRNVGHQKAIAIGLDYVSKNMQIQQHVPVVIMDSDGEDTPATIPILLNKLEASSIDVVVAQRKSRIETFRFKIFYFIYKRLFRVMTGRTISFGNFMALKIHAVKRLGIMQELSIHVAGTVLASKLQSEICPVPRGARYAGQSKMNFFGLVLHGFKALMVFAEDVIVRVGAVCALIAILSVVGAIVAIVLKILGFSTPGWFSVALGILVLIFLQTGAIALMTLMLTGVVRGSSCTKTLTYHDFVEQVMTTNIKATRV